ncbi:ParB/RepB/Spo0J family partition protein [Psychrobacillus antarcticus]|uniref:ParB/RepB/Spo0J family partition protein n=1 Tax=Psychrobacillus antarcticus TaxID=2879115 RepID=UPI0024079830|nr:ParB/RepB/Spo0J family partition protein [Psychrobacillus antarcticus]
MSRLELELVLTTKIYPNPLNPRKDYTVESEKLQKIIEKRGWETAITCYKQAEKYIILSGHRRWFAATQMGAKSIPVYIVTPPVSIEEELDRLSSAQRGKEDWTTYEWGKYIFDLASNSDENWTIKELAYKTDKGDKPVKEALKVFNYYPHSQIENKLQKNNLSITLLARIIDFINKIKIHHPAIVNELSEEMIRDNLLHKAEHKRISSTQLRSDKLLEVAPESVLKSFLRTPKMKYSDVYSLIEEDDFTIGSKIQREIKTLQSRAFEIAKMDVNNTADANLLYKELEGLSISIQLKKAELEEYLQN